MWLCGTYFCIDCTRSHYFAPSFMLLRKYPKCTQTLCNAPKHEFRVQWGGLGAFVVKNPNVTSWHELFHECAVHTVLPRVSCSYKTITNAPKHYETHENTSLGSNGVDWVLSLRKSRRDFVAWTIALIAPVHPILHRVSCSYKTIINAPKHYATHQNMSLGSNGVDWVC